MFLQRNERRLFRKHVCSWYVSKKIKWIAHMWWLYEARELARSWKPCVLCAGLQCALWHSDSCHNLYSAHVYIRISLISAKKNSLHLYPIAIKIPEKKLKTSGTADILLLKLTSVFKTALLWGTVEITRADADCIVEPETK